MQNTVLIFVRLNRVTQLMSIHPYTSCDGPHSFPLGSILKNPPPPCKARIQPLHRLQL
jgi:hypothetical protein